MVLVQSKCSFLNLIKVLVVGVPVSGIFYAEPVTIDSEDSDDEEDEDDDVTDDAATVIFKPSPYSSPAPGQWGSWSFSERFG